MNWFRIGAILAGLSVALGAFGAHGLESYAKSLSADGQADFPRRLANYETAARYQMYHALAILALGLASRRQAAKTLNAAGTCFALGVVLFCGPLYAMVLVDAKWLGAIVPLGGTLFIAGWTLLAIGAIRRVEAGPEGAA